MRKIYFTCGILLALSLSGCYLLPEEEKPVEVPQLIEVQEELYTTQPVERGDVENILNCSITIEAKENVAESFTEGGKVAKYYVMKGMQVEEGQLLAETETIDYEQQIEKQTKVIEERALDVEEAQSMLLEQNKLLDRQNETLKEEIVALEKQLDLDKSLLAEGAISQNEVDQLEKEISHKQEALDDPDTGGIVQKEMGLKKAQIAYESAVLEKTQLQEKLERSKLYASCSGTITYMTNIQEGEFIGKEDKVCQIAKRGEKRILYQGNDMDKFHVGDRVTVTADDRDYEATVIETPASIPFSERSKASYVATVYFQFVDPQASEDFSIAPNMLSLTKVLDSRKSVLRVPTTSILYLDGKSYIYVLENDVRVQKPIITGLSTAAYTEVVSGLQEGELVII